MTAQIKKYLEGRPRHRLVFVHAPVDGIKFVDIGLELAMSLEGADFTSSRLSMKAQENLKRIISEHTFDSEEFGQYVALENLNILFEPALKIDLSATIDQISRSKLLIVRIVQPLNGNLFSPFPTEKSINLDLKGFSYLEIPTREE